MLRLSHCTKVIEKNYKGLSMVGKIYAEVVVGRIHRETEELMENEQEGFRSWM